MSKVKARVLAGFAYIPILWTATMASVVLASAGVPSLAFLWLFGLCAGVAVALLANRVTPPFAFSASLPEASVAWLTLLTLSVLAMAFFQPDGTFAETLVNEGAMGIAIPLGLTLGFYSLRLRRLGGSDPVS